MNALKRFVRRYWRFLWLGSSVPTAIVDFKNPDFVKYAESFGARGYRVESADELVPILEHALDCGTVAIVDCPVDYSENMKLTEKLGPLQLRI